MPGPVMDDESYTPETGEDDSPRDTLSTSLGLARITSAPDSIKPGTTRHGVPRPPLYQYSKSPTGVRNPRLHADSFTAGLRGVAATPTPLDTLAERPEKRPRLDHQLDMSLGKPYQRGSSIEKSSSSVVGPRGSHLLSAASPRSSDVSEHDRESGSPCFNCWGSEDVVNRVVQGVQDLQLELLRALPLKGRILQGPQGAVPREVTKQGLRHSLEWTLTELRVTLQAVQDVSATSRPGLPSLTDVVPERNLAEMRRSSIAEVPSAIATPSEAWQLPLPSDPGRAEEYARKTTDHGRDLYRSSHESSLPPIQTSGEMRRTHGFDQGHTGSAQSPRGPGGFVPPSPMQTQRHDRTLPSPPSTHYHSPGYPGTSQFSSANQAAHTSHLQDLQHQISTKTLALQTLQREHDQLLAAFSRSQIRCTTLDKKSQVSDHEINSLTEEKIRLQQQVEQLETSVEELMKTRDELNKQSSADGAQWRQIMTMSSQLQIKGAEEARKYKADREAWEADRTAMQQRVTELEDGGSSLAGKQPASDTEVEDEALNTTSMDAMRQEILRLRQKCTGLERKLQDLSGETEEIDNAINAMASIRQRIASRKKQEDDS